MHWSRNINILRYNILTNELGIVEQKIHSLKKDIKELEEIIGFNELNYGLTESAIENGYEKQRNVGLTSINPSEQLVGIVSEKLNKHTEREKLFERIYLKFVIPNEYNLNQVKEVKKEIAKMISLFIEETIACLKTNERLKDKFQNELDYLERKISDPDHPEAFEIDQNYYEQLYENSTGQHGLEKSKSMDDLKAKISEKPNEIENERLPQSEEPKKESNKGITKRIDKLIEDLELKKSSKDTSEICDDICKILKEEGFNPNWHSVYATLNKLGVNNERLKIKSN